MILGISSIAENYLLDFQILSSLSIAPCTKAEIVDVHEFTIGKHFSELVVENSTDDFLVFKSLSTIL